MKTLRYLAAAAIAAGFMAAPANATTFVFKGDGYFYTIFYLIALLNPIGSSLILYILNSFILKSLLLGKFVSDVIVSLISFSIINLLNKNK